MAAALSPYTDLNEATHIDFNAPVVNFYLGGLAISKTFLMLLLLNQAYVKPGTVVLLEAPMDYFKHCQALFKSIFQKAKTHQGVLVFVADNLQESLKQPALETIYKHCYWKVLLFQGVRGIDGLLNHRLCLNQTEKRLLALNNHQILIKGDNDESAMGSLFGHHQMVL